MNAVDAHAIDGNNKSSSVWHDLLVIQMEKSSYLLNPIRVRCVSFRGHVILNRLEILALADFGHQSIKHEYLVDVRLKIKTMRRNESAKSKENVMAGT